MSDNKKKMVFFGVSNDEHIAYSNLIYAMCRCVLKKHFSDSHDVESFQRHDMKITGDLQFGVYKCIAESDIFIFLLDQQDEHCKYNPNVWFELGMIATQSEKAIIILSMQDELPFYAKTIQQIRIPDQIVEVIKNNTNVFNKTSGPITDDIREEWQKIVEPLFSSSTGNAKEAYDRFESVFVEKVKKKSNPFKHALQNVELTALGFGDLFQLVKTLVDRDKYVEANFYNTEKRAFEELTKAVQSSSKSLKTTRFANRSIISDGGTNAKSHSDFMEALCSKSREVTHSDRIICNNHYSKWRDVYSALLNGGHIKVYIKKKIYSTGFELVIVDDMITFIHFYQLSTEGNTNTDYSPNEPDNEVINSTLCLKGGEVSKNMSNVFRRLYQRSEGDPSRTLLGIPLENKNPNLTDIEKKHGYFQLDSYVRESRSNEIAYEFVTKFTQWYNYIDDVNDMINMAIGICIKLTEIGRMDYAKQIFDFIIKQDDEHKNESEDCVQKDVYNKILNFLEEEVKDEKSIEKNKIACSSLYQKMIEWKTISSQHKSHPDPVTTQNND